jgi:hypothetical protein
MASGMHYCSTQSYTCTGKTTDLDVIFIFIRKLQKQYNCRYAFKLINFFFLCVIYRTIILEDVLQERMALIAPAYNFKLHVYVYYGYRE